MTLAQRASDPNREPSIPSRARIRRFEIVRDPHESLRQLFDKHAGWIAKQATRIARRCRLSEEDGEDFASWVALRLMANDFALLRACRESRSFKAYLQTVLRNLARDYRNHVWGKWRPSALARDLGPDAVALERLCHRDGFSLQEASTMLCQDRRGVSPEIFESLACRLPPRLRREFVELEAASLESHVEPGLPSERNFDATRSRVQTVLAEALASLPQGDQEILFLHYAQGRTIAWIARSLGLHQRSVYSRRDRCLRVLFRRLEKDELAWTDVAPILERRDGQAFELWEG